MKDSKKMTEQDAPPRSQNRLNLASSVFLRMYRKLFFVLMLTCLASYAQVACAQGAQPNVNGGGGGGGGTTVVPVVFVSSSGTPSIYGSNITLTASVGPATCAPNAIATFYNNGSTIGSSHFSSNGSVGTATLTISSLAVGTQSLTANFGGNIVDTTTCDARTSPVFTQVVNQATPTIGVTSSVSPSTYGNAVTFTATVTNGDTNSVTFYSSGTSLGTATPSNGIATLTTAGLQEGSYSITAAIAAGGNYNANTSSAITQTVNKATPTVSAWPTASAITYGQTLASSTLTGGTASVSGSFAWSTPSASLVPGTSAESVTFTAGNTTDYASVTGQVNITMNKAALTVTANASSTYGVAPGALSPSYIGFQNGDTSSVLSGSPTLTSSVTASSPAGTYPITVTDGTLAAANYTISATNGTFTVNKATPALSLTWSPGSPTHDHSVAFTCSATSGGQPVLNGAVLAFSVNGTNEASVATASGSSAWSTTSLILGVNTVGCSSGDANYNVVTISKSITIGATTDAGNMTLTVNGTVAATTTYGVSSTPDSIAAGLVAGITSGSPVTLSEADGILYLTAKTAGSASNLSYSIGTTWDNADFTEPSFLVSPVSGNLDGGDAQNASTGTIYSFSIPSYVYGSASSGYDAAGNVVGYTDQLLGPNGANTTDGWLFPYDTLNRLTGAAHSQTNSSGQTSSNYCWSYDPFGNRTLNYDGACTTGLPLIGYSTNNQLNSGLQGYDAAGDITVDVNAGNSYLYDADGRICAVKGQTVTGVMVMTGYVYNAEGERVSKGPITAMSCDLAASGLQTASESDYVLGPSGEQLTEMGNGNTTWVHTNVFAAGELFATYDHGGLHFYANDWLGSRRVQTDYAGVPEQTCTNLPFGDGLVCSDSLVTPTEHHFTGKERDTESGNDYFEARYYGSSMGRFLSPDFQNMDDDDVPEAIANGSTANPQTLNLYSYTQNNPLTRRDYDGHASWQPCADGSGSQCWSGDYAGEKDCSGGSGCLFWNGQSHQWQGSDPYQPPADDPAGAFMMGFGRVLLSRNGTNFGYGAKMMAIAAASDFLSMGAKSAAALIPFGRPPFVPANWTEKPSRKGDGTKFQDPDNPHNSVRIMKGQEGNSNPGQQQDYMVIRKDGQTLNSGGTPSSDPSETHIPVGTEVPPDIFEGPIL